MAEGSAHHCEAAVVVDGEEVIDGLDAGFPLPALVLW